MMVDDVSDLAAKALKKALTPAPNSAAYAAHREALLRDAYDKLKAFCAERGIQVQVDQQTDEQGKEQPEAGSSDITRSNDS